MFLKFNICQLIASLMSSPTSNIDNTIVPKRNGRILVVDDELTLLRLLNINLKKHGYDVSLANGGKKALDILEKDSDFDLILLDVMMPDITGYQVCRIIREKYSLYELPVMFVTAKYQVHDIIEGLDIGANDYILKPFDSNELIARSNTLVKLKKLTKANEQLQDLQKLSENFHMMTIHDLKNPLTSIIIRSEFIEHKFSDNPEILELTGAISKSSNYMVKLINEYVEMGKIQIGKLSLRKEKINLNIIVMDSINENLDLAKAKNQELRFSPGPNDKCKIMADSIRIKEVVDNLLSNAIKYSPYNKPIDLNIDIIEVEHNAKFVQFSIKDYGQGLSKDDLIIIFDKFQRLSSKPTGNETSTGLGLSIAKELIELHKGKLWVESELEEGSTFYFKIPVAGD